MYNLLLKKFIVHNKIEINVYHVCIYVFFVAYKMFTQTFQLSLIIFYWNRLLIDI